MSKPANVQEIVEAHLKANGYDGLYNFVGECGCEVSDLDPGNCFEASCEPGYKEPCTGDNCPLDGDCDWHISPKKPETTP